MVRENYEVRVGFFTLFALILLLYGWGWLKSFSPFDPPLIFWVRFHDVAGLSNNATVNIQGVRVGTVDQISFTKPEALQEEPEATPEDIRLPRVYTRVRISSGKIPIPKNAAITIQTIGLVGAKYMEITLPEAADEQGQPLIDPNLIVRGHDPVRVELVINNVAKKLNRVADAVSSEEAASALKDLAKASSKLNKNLDRMPDVTDSIKKASDNISVTAEKAQSVASNANRFFNEGSDSFSSVTVLARDMNKTNSKVGRILDNPDFSKDLKETVNLAHKTALSVSATIADLNTTVKDKDLRQDLQDMLTKLQTSSEDIKQSVHEVNGLANDDALRTDLKDIIKSAKEAMDKANNLMGEPNFRVDFKQTMAKVKAAAEDVDIAAKQIHQVLGKRAPLFHMMFGNPGKVKLEVVPPENTRETLQDGTTVNVNGGPH